MLGATLNAQQYLASVQRDVGRLDGQEMERLAQLVYQRYLSRRFVYIIGNGGSGSNASHFCEDLGKGTAPADEAAPRLKVLSLTDNAAYIMAWANDASYERVFVEQLKNLGEPGDLLIAISGSGNSPNILRAVEWANAHQLTTFGMTGFQGGKLRQLAHDSFHVPVPDMGMVETLHVICLHYVVGRVHALVNNTKKQGKVA